MDKSEIKLYLKQHITIRYNSKKIILSGGKKDFTIIKNKTNLEFIKNLIEKGLLKIDFIDEDIYNYLIINNYLTESNQTKQNRNEIFLNYLDSSINLNKIKESKILILGSGGGGSSVTFGLAQFGLNKLIIIDYDVVEKSDLYKTNIYRNENIGQKKVYALKKIIYKNFNFKIKTHDKKVNNYDYLENIIQRTKPNLIINAIDPDPKHKIEINKIAIKHNTPIFFLAYSYEMLISGPLIVPKHTSCYNSYFKHIKDKTNNLINFNTIKKLKSNKLTHPSVSFNTNLLASLVIKDCIMFLSNQKEYLSTYNKILFINSLTLEINDFTLKCNSKCICKL